MTEEMQLENKAFLEEDVTEPVSETGEYDHEPATHPEIKTALDELMRSFESFKTANDDRLQELEARGATDPLTEEKLANINCALDEQQSRIDDILKKSRPAANDNDPSDENSAHKAAFDAYMRKGDEAGFSRLESKALSVGSEADGGYLVPEETERTISHALEAVSPFHAIAGRQSITSGLFKKPFAISGAGAGWVGETAARPQTATPQLAELAFPTMELYAMPAATTTLLEDAAVDIDAWLAEEVQSAFAAAESAAFISGDGNNKPQGLLAYPTVHNSAWSWGNLGFIATGAEDGFDPAGAADALIDLIYSLKSGYRANARFLMNRVTQAETRKLKDGDGNYLWQPTNAGAKSPTLMGFPISEAEDMPDIAAGSHSIAFGDFKRGYLIVERQGTRVLRDRYSAKPYVLFYTTRRVGGGIQDFEALKLLKFAA